MIGFLKDNLLAVGLGVIIVLLTIGLVAQSGDDPEERTVGETIVDLDDEDYRAEVVTWTLIAEPAMNYIAETYGNLSDLADFGSLAVVMEGCQIVVDEDYTQQAADALAGAPDPELGRLGGRAADAFMDGMRACARGDLEESTSDAESAGRYMDQMTDRIEEMTDALG